MNVQRLKKELLESDIRERGTLLPGGADRRWHLVSLRKILLMRDPG